MSVHHEQQREVIKAGRDDRHPDHVEAPPPLRLVTDNPEFRTSANTASSSFAFERTGFHEWFVRELGLKHPIIDELEYDVDVIPRFNSTLERTRRHLEEATEEIQKRLRRIAEVETEDDQMAGPTREEIDAKLETVAAQTDTKLARLEGKVDLVLSKLDDAREGNRHTQNIAISVGIGLALLIIGVVAAAPVIFDLGSKFHETIIKEMKRTPESSPQ
jgi:hypothetical protein